MESFAGNFVAEYDEYLRMSNLVDFDDLIIQTNAYLGETERLERWSARYKYIIVDEMQDTSVLEYTVLKKIFGKNRIMFCGDFFQTIYGWRGSNPNVVLEDYITNFSARTYMFSENYRSTQTLAAATFGYLKNTYPQLIGKYCPSDLQIHSETQGDKIGCYAFSNREEEAWQIYNHIRKNPPQDPSKLCIMARSNKYIAELFNYFEKFNRACKEETRLRFFTVEENFNFFKRAVVKDFLAVLKLLVNPTDRVSMERLTAKFVRGVGMETIEKLRTYNACGVSILSFLDPQTYLYGDNYRLLLDGAASANLVVYDTETTGLDLAKDEIVQISAVKINGNGDILDTLDVLVEPTVAISQAAYETHGFHLEYIRAHGGVTAKEALEKFSAFVDGCVLVGHNNLAYDRPLVRRQLKENGLPPFHALAEYDTLLMAKQFYPSMQNYKLSTLCERFSVVNECAHNALGDITATGKCLAFMINDKIRQTALERYGLLVKHRAKFEKIYAFMQEMKERLCQGEELAEFAIERLMLRKKYPSPRDSSAMQDLIDSLRPNGAITEAFLAEYLRDAALSGSQMDVLVEKLQKIPIITVHQAKGCEFDTVFLAGADDNNFPSFAARQSGDDEEEKKVFYVAITRAKKKLILTRATWNKNFKYHETPYFWKIPSEYVEQNSAWKNGE